MSIGPSRSSASPPKVPCFATFEMRRWSKKINTKLTKSSQTISLVLDVPTYKKAKKKNGPPAPKIPKSVGQKSKNHVILKKKPQEFQGHRDHHPTPHDISAHGAHGPPPHLYHLEPLPTPATGQVQHAFGAADVLRQRETSVTGGFGGNSTPEKKQMPHQRCTTKHDFNSI